MKLKIKKYNLIKASSFRIRESISVIMFVFFLLFVFQSCVKSGSGGTTGGNPLQSSLPQQIAIDAE